MRWASERSASLVASIGSDRVARSGSNAAQVAISRARESERSWLRSSSELVLIRARSALIAMDWALTALFRATRRVRTASIAPSRFLRAVISDPSSSRRAAA